MRRKKIPHDWRVQVEFSITDKQAASLHVPSGVGGVLGSHNMVNTFCFCGTCELLWEESHDKPCAGHPVVAVQPN